MKKLFGRIIPVISVIAVCAVVITIIAAYFNFISQRIYEDSTSHLYEIYAQVNRSFGSFVERNWGLLRGWGRYFSAVGDDEAVAEFVTRERDYWGFTELYFISADGGFITADGRKSSEPDGEGFSAFIESGEPTMSGQTLPNGKGVTVFAMPTERSEFRGVEYEAVAISYTNDDLASSLNVDAFSGKAKCFVVDSDGSVLLSTRTGGSVYKNYIQYLGAASDIGEEGLESLTKDWENGLSGLVQCKIGGEDQCILYQPVGYQDFVLLSAVPESSVSAGFLSVQKITANVLLAIFLIIGVTAAVFLIMRYSSEKKSSSIELQYRELMFSVLSNSVDDIFIMLDSENQNVDYISPNVERLLGIPADEARKNIRALEKCAVNYNVVIPKSEIEKIPLNGSICRECEYMHQSTGERRWYRMTVYHSSIQNVEKYIAVMSDRTDEQQMNLKLREALDAARSANEAKSNFLANMSHDIRTPMNAIVGFSVLLEKDADKPDKVKEYTRKITASSHHLLSLINDVLDMSKIESGKTSLSSAVFSLPELLEELGIIILPQTKAKDQDFMIHVVGAPPEKIVGDRLRLNQILLNLLSNAVKYTQVGGKIEFSVSEIKQDAPQFVKLRFAVKDNGIGMSEEFVKKVFAPFSREINSVTNTVQGTGLGMAITKNLVDLMGGIILVESEPDKGSTFTVELTFALPEQGAEESRVESRIRRMLVCDDDEDICLGISEMMKDTEIDVSCVTSGSAAVGAAVSAHERNEDFDIILLDWKMPEMDGVETARKIRGEIGHDVPILVLTSYDWSDIEEEARAAGINAFMPKPFFVSTFRQTVEPLFTAPEAPSEPSEEESKKIMNGLMFLVAEDNSLNAEILTEMLRMEGADCELAHNGLEAAEMFEQSPKGHYDMILMDVQMPIMNGYDATRRIRASVHPEAKTIPIVAMTANTFAEDVRNSIEAGMNAHLAKPIDMAKVCETVGRLMEKKRPQKGESEE